MKTDNTIREIAITYSRPPLKKMAKVTCSKDAEAVFRNVADSDRIDYKEFFWVMVMSRSNHVLGVSQIGVGTTSGTEVNVKEVFQLALKTNASGILLCHNHPSGNLTPSQADIQITTKIQSGCKLFDVTLLDHLIITSEGYYSFQDEGRL